MIAEQTKRISEGFKRIALDWIREGWAKIFMPNTFESESATFASCRPLLDSFLAGNSAGAHFFDPLEAILSDLTKTRICHDLPDADWLALGVLRVLHEVKSGRGFLQEIAAGLPNCPDVSQFFSTQRSSRRLDLCREADALLAESLKEALPDPIGGIPELEKFDIYAGDGHWLSASAHDERPFPDSRKRASGHFYTLDLRRHLLRHLDVADEVNREHEHDMRALKRLTVADLRQGAGKGRKVLYVWDRAGIDFKAWEQWKQRAIYFLSREKENMVFTAERALEWECEDPRNAGVISDELAVSASGAKIRRVRFIDSVTGKEYVFLTNEMTLPPGVIAELARRRWEIEKVFDQLKNKLGETKAWGKTTEAKKMQATFICITHQLLLALEHLLAAQHDIRPERELKRREKRIEEEGNIAKKSGWKYPSLRAAAKRLTQRTVKFLRWLRSSLRQNAPWPVLIDALRRSYASR